MSNQKGNRKDMGSGTKGKRERRKSFPFSLGIVPSLAGAVKGFGQALYPFGTNALDSPGQRRLLKNREKGKNVVLR